MSRSRYYPGVRFRREPRPTPDANEHLREILDGVIEHGDVPDGDYSSVRAGVLAVWDARTRVHRRPRRRPRHVVMMQTWMRAVLESHRTPYRLVTMPPAS